MRFISPRTDFSFKKIFGSENSKDILISFLNAMLYEGNSTITDLEIINPYSGGKLPTLKESYLDVQANLNNGTKVIIEMQVAHTSDFEERVVYNLAKSYANQLTKGQVYSALKPVIELIITDFKMFDDSEEVISSFLIMEEKRGCKYLKDTLKMVFVELPKFHKKLEDLASLTDKWIYFMKTSDDLETVPEKLQNIPAIEKAFSIANRANLTLVDLEEIEKAELFILSQQDNLNEAKKQSWEEGLAAGVAQGMAQGVAQGQISLIVQLLSQRWGEISQEIVEKIRNLSSDKLANLTLVMLNFTNQSELVNWLDSQPK